MHDRIEAAHKKWLAAQEKVVNIMQMAAPADSPVDLAEGIRWAGRLTSIAQDWILEKNEESQSHLFLYNCILLLQEIQLQLLSWFAPNPAC